MTATPGFVRTDDVAFDALPDWPYQPQYLFFEGLRMHYVDEGPRDGPVFLLTHGEPSWSYLYRRWIPRLVDAGFRVIAPDHIGFGRSDKVTEDDWYTIERHVALQRELVVHLDLHDVHLFCQDWGGPISLANACDLPDRYSRLFIANTWLHHEGFVYSDALRKWRELATDPAQLGGDMPTGLLLSIAQRREGHDREALQAAYDAPFLGLGVEAKAGARRFPFCLPFAEPELGTAARQQWCFDHLRSWAGPVHLVWGDADPNFPWSWAEEWASVIPGATLDRIAGAGHFLQEDAPDDCVDAILARLQDD